MKGTEELQSFRNWEPLLWQLFDEDRSGRVYFSEFSTALAAYDLKLSSEGMASLEDEDSEASEGATSSCSESES